MAYMSQEHKKQIAEKAKKVLKKYGVKGSFAVRVGWYVDVNIGKWDKPYEYLS